MLQLLFKDASRKTLWLVEPRYTIGSDAGCTLPVSDTRLKAQHAVLQLNGDVGLITNLVGDTEIRVNGIPVSGSHKLVHGDTLGLGLTELMVVDRKRHTQKHQISEPPENPEHWQLIPSSRALGTRDYTIAESALVGRARDCDISLGVAHLSRHHARLTVTERGLKVEDLDSANGTFVNGQRIKTAVMKPGDQLSFDTVKFKIVGPQTNLDVTTVRPVISVPTPKPAASGIAKSHRPTGSRDDTPKPSRSALGGINVDPGAGELSANTGNNTKLWVAVALLALIGVAAYLAWQHQLIPGAS